MKTSIARTSSHLFRRGSIFYFRYLVPKEFQNELGRREFRYSLNTGYLKDARRRAGKLHVLFQELIDLFRKDDSMAKASMKEIMALVHKRVRESLKEEEEDLMLRKEPFDDHKLYERVDLLKSFRGDNRMALARADNSDIKSAAKRFLSSEGIEYPEDSMSLIAIGREILKSYNTCFDILIKRSHGIYSDDLEKLLPISLDSVQFGMGVDLEQAFQEYLEYKLKSGEWSEASLKDYVPVHKRFIEVVGNKDVAELSKDDIRFYKRVVMNLPKNYSKKTNYRNMSYEELAKLDVPEADRMSPNTVNTKFVKIGSFLTWLEQQGYLKESGYRAVLGSIRVKAQGRSKAKAPFSKEDLERLFSGKNYVQDKFKYPYQFWVPLLGLFTGARLEELCQLHVSDLKKEKGIWIIDINDEGGKHVKNASSRRKVPIHPFLIDDLRLMDYVHHQKNKGEIRLFPNLQARNSTGKTGDKVSSWFRRLLKREGVKRDTPDGTKSFHSFRGTFTNYCKQNDLHEKKVKEIVGHSHDDVTEAHYNREYSLEKLYEEVIRKIDYGIDLSHLRRSKFVISDI